MDAVWLRGTEIRDPTGEELQTELRERFHSKRYRSYVLALCTHGVVEMAADALYNLGAIRRGAYDDPPLFANDVVVVGESQGRRLFQSIVQAGALVTAPIVALLQR